MPIIGYPRERRITRVLPPGTYGLAIQATIPSRGSRSPVGPKVPETAARRPGIRNDRGRATWAPRASTCTINRRFASGWPNSSSPPLLPVPRAPYVWHVARRLRSAAFLAAGLPAEPRGPAKRASPTADSARAAFRRRRIFATRRPVAVAPLVQKHNVTLARGEH
jgi:hypothetical protein